MFSIRIAAQISAKVEDIDAFLIQPHDFCNLLYNWVNVHHKRNFVIDISWDHNLLQKIYICNETEIYGDIMMIEPSASLPKVAY